MAFDHWFAADREKTTVGGEVDDVAMLPADEKHDLGLFVAPTVVRREICRQYHAAGSSGSDRVRENFCSIAVERRIAHPQIRLIAEQAGRRLFS